ncbi:hypothetical protein [Burkholderia pseudomallei]|uniref:hypothetical protein n=1 Tax=Burkholderia pseudomallei TaxID=28450 RepID=UPI00190BC38A|nr:hypothetical protein [Burkholderia pseudomallei]MBK3333528.1 hypothetical protein [Burkholderia pseudomallei]
MATSRVLEAIAVTAELCGKVFSPAAARQFAADLSPYPESQVLCALERCRREVKGVLSLADVIARLDDGRPSADEAWAMMPRDESQSVVWTDEMAVAWGLALPLLAAGEPISARVAFRDCYTRVVTLARAERRAAQWRLSPGRDPDGRRTAITDAVDKGRLTPEHAMAMLPVVANAEADAMLLEQIGLKVKRIGGPQR